MSQNNPLLSHVSVEYMPQIGYLTAIPEASQHFLASEMFNLVYANEGTLYYKNPDMYGMSCACRVT